MLRRQLMPVKENLICLAGSDGNRYLNRIAGLFVIAKTSIAAAGMCYAVPRPKLRRLISRPGQLRVDPLAADGRGARKAHWPDITRAAAYYRRRGCAGIDRQ